MRTTLDLPADLIKEAQELLGFKSKTDTVVASLRELIRHRRIEDLQKLLDEGGLQIDIPASRERLAASAAPARVGRRAGARASQS